MELESVVVTGIGIQQEASRQILKMQSDTKKKCESMIDSTKKEVNMI